VELSNTYANKKATFGEAVLDILEQTEGKVYLIGLIEARADDDNATDKKILINPGPTYKIKSVASTGTRTMGVFIAPDREAIVQCEEGQVFLGRKDRPADNDDQAMQLALEREGQGPEWSGENNDEMESQQKSTEMDESQEGQNVQGGLSQAQQKQVRQLMRLTDLQKEGANPSSPPLELLAKGGHAIFISVGAKGADDLRLGAIHFARPLRANLSSQDNILPIVVMAPVQPNDWHTVAGFKEMYFMSGSPLSLFDLERVNFRAASVIVINHSGGGGSGVHTDPYMVDSEAIFCARLIESHIGSPSSGPKVIAELTFDMNYHFIPLPGAAAATQALLQNQLLEMEQSGEKKELAVENSVSEYFRQPRFACGQLFISNVVTSLVVNTFYNQSLAQLVQAMVGAHVKTVVVPREWEGKSYMEYFDYLLWEKHLMAIGIFRKAQGALVEPRTSTKSLDRMGTMRKAGTVRLPGGAVGAKISDRMSSIFAKAEKTSAPANIPPQSYLYCAPPAKEASMNPHDRVLCFGVAISESQPAGSRVRSSFMDPG